ncbi:hypothetical protein BH23CHL8_BH23CHL8_07500 [soil metagenome]
MRSRAGTLVARVTVLAFAATSLLASASLAGGPACTVRGTAGDDTWTVRRTPVVAGDIPPDAVVCGGPGHDRLRTPGRPFRGTFFAGGGHDSVGTIAREGTFRGGRGADHVSALRGGVFRGGPGPDRVEAMTGGRFVGGGGDDRASIGPFQIVRDDLAHRLASAPEHVRLVSVVFVRWSDASLGCPLDGFVYASVITPGFRVLLAVDGETYPYHTDAGTRAVPASDPACQGVGGA